MITAYKKDQGRMVRMAAFYMAALLLLFASTALHTSLSSFDALDTAIGGMVVPIVSVTINWAFVISTSLLVAGLVALYRWQQQPKVADLLIETEGELRKVTWPGLQQVIDSSMVVVVCVIFLMAFMFFADIALEWLINPWVAGR